MKCHHTQSRFPWMAPILVLASLCTEGCANGISPDDPLADGTQGVVATAGDPEDTTAQAPVLQGFAATGAAAEPSAATPAPSSSTAAAGTAPTAFPPYPPPPYPPYGYPPYPYPPYPYPPYPYPYPYPPPPAPAATPRQGDAAPAESPAAPTLGLNPRIPTPGSGLATGLPLPNGNRICAPSAVPMDPAGIAGLVQDWAVGFSGGRDRAALPFAPLVDIPKPCPLGSDSAVK